MESSKNRFALTSGFKLFLFSVPFLAVVFLFNYLPLYGWIYSFYDYHVGLKLSQTEFVGLKNFQMIIDNPVLVSELMRVMRNTFAMSFLGLITSPLPLIFAIMITEARGKFFKRAVQTLTTLPNFISWILMYSVIWAMFSVGDGFVNRVLLKLHLISDNINFLGSPDHVWLKMLLYATWKGLGWGAILYLAAITSIDQEQYEAATVEGASRFQKIWHITIPGIMPTYFVLLLLSIANFINNGMEQYFIFQNAMNKDAIEVLDLYVYNTGMVGTSISYATAIGMLKSVVSIVLLFLANRLSKLVRGETII